MRIKVATDRPDSSRKIRPISASSTTGKDQPPAVSANGQTSIGAEIVRVTQVSRHGVLLVAAGQSSLSPRYEQRLDAWTGPSPAQDDRLRRRVPTPCSGQS
jgi:hypothetical protein